MFAELDVYDMGDYAQHGKVGYSGVNDWVANRMQPQDLVGVTHGHEQCAFGQLAANEFTVSIKFATIIEFSDVSVFINH